MNRKKYVGQNENRKHHHQQRRRQATHPVIDK
jgi:hypothetical protein